MSTINSLLSQPTVSDRHGTLFSSNILDTTTHSSTRVANIYSPPLFACLQSTYIRSFSSSVPNLDELVTLPSTGMRDSSIHRFKSNHENHSKRWKALKQILPTKLRRFGRSKLSAGQRARAQCYNLAKCS